MLFFFYFPATRAGESVCLHVCVCVHKGVCASWLMWLVHVIGIKRNAEPLTTFSTAGEEKVTSVHGVRRFKKYFYFLVYSFFGCHSHTHTYTRGHVCLHMCVCAAAYDNCRLHCVHAPARGIRIVFDGLLMLLSFLLFTFYIFRFFVDFFWFIAPFIDIVNVIAAIGIVVFYFVAPVFLFFIFYIIAVCFCWRVSFSFLQLFLF